MTGVVGSGAATLALMNSYNSSDQSHIWRELDRS